jgi:hypothetical protein
MHTMQVQIVTQCAHSPKRNGTYLRLEGGVPLTEWLLSVLYFRQEHPALKP